MAIRMARAITATAFFLLIASCAAFAQDDPLVFRRDVITIYPGTQPSNLMGEQADETGAVELEVEIRPMQAFEVNWMHMLSQVASQYSSLIMLPYPYPDVIDRRPFFQPVDILSIDEEGFIVQIVPQVVLAELREPLYTDEPVLARLIMAGGGAQALGIKPGDKVEHPFFTPSPEVLK